MRNSAGCAATVAPLGGPASVPATLEYAYQYDDIGNRITSTDLGTNRTYTANNLNQYSAITTSDIGLQTSSFEPQFDDDGNQTLIQTSTGVWFVTYNGENRPVIWTGGTQSATTNIVMSFDRMGRRVEYRETQTIGAVGGNTPRTTANAQHRFVYDNYLCIQRLDAATANAVDLAFVWDVTEVEYVYWLDIIKKRARKKGLGEEFEFDNVFGDPKKNKLIYENKDEEVSKIAIPALKECLEGKK